MWAQAGVQGAGRWAQALLAGVRTGAGMRGQARACAEGRGWARARAGRACAGRHAGGRAGSRRARGRQRAAGRGRTRGRARQDARQGAAVRSRGAAGARPGLPGRSLGVQLGQVGCFGPPDSVFGPVRLGSFLSHQMNTVHCKINFQKKNIYKI